VTGAMPRTLLGELTTLPRPPSWICGRKGKEREEGKVRPQAKILAVARLSTQNKLLTSNLT